MVAEARFAISFPTFVIAMTSSLMSTDGMMTMKTGTSRHPLSVREKARFPPISFLGFQIRIDQNLEFSARGSLFLFEEKSAKGGGWRCRGCGFVLRL